MTLCETTDSTNTRNPWLAAGGITLDRQEPEFEPEDPTPPAPGPTAPQGGVPEPRPSDRLPRARTEIATALWWVGVHGGAGESTLAALVPGSRAAGHAWPAPASDPVGPGLTPVVLLARTSMGGIRAAQRAAIEWAAGELPHLELLGLVWIADAPGRLPRALRDSADVVSGGVPRVWRVPWIEEWRIGAGPSIDGCPKQVRRLVEDVRALVPELHAASRGTD